MPNLIRPDELPRWVPGEILLASDALGWREVTLRSYRYAALDVEVPAMRDFMIVAYRRGPTPMDRRFDGRWSREQMVPGDVSLLTRAEWSHWNWRQPIDVVQVYLSQAALARVAAEVFDRDVADVRLADVLKAPDPVLFNAALAIADEVARQGLGGEMYVDAVATQMCVHLLRRYSTVLFNDRRTPAGLALAAMRCLEDYADARLGERITLADLASVAGMSSHHFLRAFKRRYGIAPHAWLIRRRVARAARLIARSRLPLKAVAMECGFSDQAHMTRLFGRVLAKTPAQVRAAARG
jgi:AraC family transcriptional regulator